VNITQASFEAHGGPEHIRAQIQVYAEMPEEAAAELEWGKICLDLATDAVLHVTNEITRAAARSGDGGGGSAMETESGGSGKKHTTAGSTNTTKRMVHAKMEALVARCPRRPVVCVAITSPQHVKVVTAVAESALPASTTVLVIPGGGGICNNDAQNPHEEPVKR
jgi:hypothetical protein